MSKPARDVRDPFAFSLIRRENEQGPISIDSCRDESTECVMITFLVPSKRDKSA
jgi:hypothetical protein